MTTLKILLEYDGTRYRGWQEQTNARTVMGELRKAAKVVFRSDVEMQGAGRTDAGVHALGQVAHIKVNTPIRHKVDVIAKILNELLPADIVVLDVEQVRRSFHARHDATTRVYRYQISNRKQAFIKKYVWWVKEPLNLDVMQRGAAMLVGRHDFVCFRAEDPARPHEPTVVVVEGTDLESEDDIITFRIEASHFLWRMVRRVVGVLVRLGSGEITEHDFRKLLSGHRDPKLDVAAWTAPASGLFLEHVRYATATEGPNNLNYNG